jgi:hypothetical protein
MPNLRLSQLVWFWKDWDGRGGHPEPAIVTAIHDEMTVDLWVFCPHGAQRPESKVPLRDDRVGQPPLPYAVPDEPLGRCATFNVAPQGLPRQTGEKSAAKSKETAE